jgi:hypothetical protein
MELEKGKGTLRDAVCPRRRTEGVKPGTVKATSPVLNGGDEATGLVRPRLRYPMRMWEILCICTCLCRAG